MRAIDPFPSAALYFIHTSLATLTCPLDQPATTTPCASLRVHPADGDWEFPLGALGRTLRRPERRTAAVLEKTYLHGEGRGVGARPARLSVLEPVALWKGDAF